MIDTLAWTEATTLRTPVPVIAENNTTTSLAAAPLYGTQLMTVWLDALVAVTSADFDGNLKMNSEAALSEVAFTYWTRMRSRPLAGTTTLLRMDPALPVIQ